MTSGRSGSRAWLTINAGYMALVCLAAASWVLVALAGIGSFEWWILAVPWMAAASGFALAAFLQRPRLDLIAAAAICVLSGLLYLPAGQHLALSSDAAIYANEGAWLARSHGLSGVHDALAATSETAREIFYVSNEEQFEGRPVAKSYEGIVYGGYYLTDADASKIGTSRMPQVTAWNALLLSAFGLNGTFYVSYAFAVGALLLLYLLAARFYQRPIALWATALLGLSYAQVYLARAPLAEVTGQFWTIAGLLFAVGWLQTRRAWLLPGALLMWATSWSARVDSLLLLGLAAILLVIAAYDRDTRSLAYVAATIPLVALLGYVGTNFVYVRATWELFSSYLPVVPGAIALLVAVPAALAVAWWGGPTIRRLWTRVGAPVSLVLFLALAFVVLWSTIPNGWRDADVTRHYQEIMWFSSEYVTPIFYWLALGGIGLLLLRGFDRAEFFVMASLVALGAAYFYTYTSANVYPISMRRLVSDVFPLMAISAGFALARLPDRPWRLPVQGVLAVTSLVWMAFLTMPLFDQREYPDDAAFIQELHERLPADGAFIFERQDTDSWVGWLAAPLFSLYADWTLLLDSDAPAPEQLSQAVADLEAAGRTVYLVSQTDPPPAALVPTGYVASPVESLRWQSAMIGQTRAPYPPPYWEFDLPLHLFRFDPEAQ
jgi:hypothetical protein